MSGVDVLAVIDEVARFHDNGSEAFDSLREARAEVAEMIAALETLVDSVDPESTGWDEAVYVLSRVRGAA